MKKRSPFKTSGADAIRPRARLWRRVFGLAATAAFLAPGAAFCRPLRVTTYNVWGLPSPLLRHGERFDRIPGAIAGLDADVVLIQEAFTGKAQRLTSLPQYPYHAWGPGTRFLHFSSGLLILSKYPIEETATITYSHCGGFDCFANKGAVYARIRVPGGGDVSVFNTHLNANGHDEARASQAAHLQRFVRSYSQGLPTIVGGDFNGEGRTLFQKIKDALTLRDAQADFVRENPGAPTRLRDGYTADPSGNPYLGRDETRRRLDHIYLLDGSKPWKVVDYGLVFDGIKGQVLSDHFGVSVAADLAR